MNILPALKNLRRYYLTTTMAIGQGNPILLHADDGQWVRWGSIQAIIDILEASNMVEGRIERKEG